MNRIKELRKKFGYNQQKLAALIGDGVSQAAISKWEKGESFPRKERVKKLCEIFDVSEDVLMGTSAHVQDAKDKPQEKIKAASPFIDGEKQLLDLYRGADEAGRKVIMSVAGLEYNRRRAELLKE